MIATLIDFFAQAQGWLFETLVQPLLYWTGLGEFAEQAYEGCEWLLIGIVEISLLFIVLRPLESWLPAQPITDPHARWNDFLYTVVHRLGAFAVVIPLVTGPRTVSIGGESYALTVNFHAASLNKALIISLKIA